MKTTLLEGVRAVGKGKSTFSHEPRGPVLVATVRVLGGINSISKPSWKVKKIN